MMIKHNGSLRSNDDPCSTAYKKVLHDGISRTILIMVKSVAEIVLLGLEVVCCFR
jgi:hypothetical protein